MFQFNLTLVPSNSVCVLLSFIEAAILRYKKFAAPTIICCKYYSFLLY